MKKIVEEFLSDPRNIEKRNALYDYALVNYRDAATLSNEIKGELSRHGVRL
jgi:hypothetical protein